MKLCALMPVRNEDWILGLSARVVLRYADHLVVLNHASTDRSAELLGAIADEHPGRVTVLEETDGKWDEMAHRQRMLEAARAAGATHIAITDADEVLTGNIVPMIRDLIENLPPRSIMMLPGYNLRGGIDKYHSNGIWANRWFSFAFQDDPALGWNGDRFHQREPMGAPFVLRRTGTPGNGGIMHLWGANERRLVAKHRAYKITERLRWPDKSIAEIDRLYSLAIHGQPGDRRADWRYTHVLPEWWDPYVDLVKHLDIYAEPWQEAECERLIAQHGADHFAGLDLFRAEVPA